MNRWLVLTGLTTVFGGLLIWEILAPDDAANTAAPALAPPRTASVEPPPPDNGVLSEAATTVLNRPLFSPDRRMAEPAAAAAAATSPTAELPRLAGVIVGPSGRHAIFADTSGHPQVATEGSSIGRYTVQTIQPGQVTVTSSEGERVLRPSFTDIKTPASDGPPAVPAAVPIPPQARVRAR